MTNSDQTTAFHRTKFICVDRDAEVVPNTPANPQTNLLYHVRVSVVGTSTFPALRMTLRRSLHAWSAASSSETFHMMESEQLPICSLLDIISMCF